MNTIRCLRGNVFRIFQGSSASFLQDTNPNPEISENKLDREGLGIVTGKLYYIRQCNSAFHQDQPRPFPFSMENYGAKEPEPSE